MTRVAGRKCMERWIVVVLLLLVGGRDAKGTPVIDPVYDKVNRVLFFLVIDGDVPLTWPFPSARIRENLGTWIKQELADPRPDVEVDWEVSQRATSAMAGPRDTLRAHLHATLRVWEAGPDSGPRCIGTMAVRAHRGFSSASSSLPTNFVADCESRRIEEEFLKAAQKTLRTYLVNKLAAFRPMSPIAK